MSRPAYETISSRKSQNKTELAAKERREHKDE
jgi:hypothetical protein